MLPNPDSDPVSALLPLEEVFKTNGSQFRHTRTTTSCPTRRPSSTRPCGAPRPLGLPPLFLIKTLTFSRRLFPPAPFIPKTAVTDTTLTFKTIPRNEGEPAETKTIFIPKGTGG